MKVEVRVWWLGWGVVGVQWMCDEEGGEGMGMGGSQSGLICAVGKLLISTRPRDVKLLCQFIMEREGH